MFVSSPTTSGRDRYACEHGHGAALQTRPVNRWRAQECQGEQARAQANRNMVFWARGRRRDAASGAKRRRHAARSADVAPGDGSGGRAGGPTENHAGGPGSGGAQGLSGQAGGRPDRRARGRPVNGQTSQWAGARTGGRPRGPQVQSGLGGWAAWQPGGRGVGTRGAAGGGDSSGG